MIPLTAAEQAHRTLLERWRGALDLVGPGPLEPHFEDAALSVGWLSPEGRWADLGSGAGFPGVALAARFPEITVDLVESRQKRAIFLDQVLAASCIKNATIMRQRVEDLPGESYDGVVSRAYKPPAEYLADALRLLRPGGTAVLLLAQKEAPDVPGLAVFHVEHYSVDGRQRSAVGYRKMRS